MLSLIAYLLLYDVRRDLRKWWLGGKTCED